MYRSLLVVGYFQEVEDGDFYEKEIILLLKEKFLCCTDLDVNVVFTLFWEMDCNLILAREKFSIYSKNWVSNFSKT